VNAYIVAVGVGLGAALADRLRDAYTQPPCAAAVSGGAADIMLVYAVPPRFAASLGAALR
jgi:hypothetical protein